MKVLVLITCISYVVLVKSSIDVGAMESHSHSYEVYPDPQDVAEEENDSGVVVDVQTPKMDGNDDRNVNVENNQHYDMRHKANKMNSIWQALSGHDEKKVRQNYSLTYQNFQSPEEQQQQRSQYFSNRHQNVLEEVSQESYEDKEHKTSFDEEGEYSSVVQRVVEKDNFYPNNHGGSIEHVKRTVPKSNVYFKVYHPDKGVGEQETAYHSNVDHTKKENVQRPAANGYFGRYGSLDNQNVYKNSVNVVGGRPISINTPEKSLIHSKLSLRTKHQGQPGNDAHKTSFQSASKDENFYFDGKTRNNLIKEQKYKLNVPSQILSPQHPQQYYSHQQQEQYYHNAQHEKPYSEHVHPAKSQIRVVYPKALPFYSVENQPPVAINHQTQTGNIQHPKYLKDVKPVKGTKNVHAFQGTKASGHTGSYAVTEEEDAFDKENVKSEPKQKAVSSTLSNTVVIGDSSPWKINSESKKLQQLWKNLKNLPPIKSIDFEHSFSHLPLVYKPADSFHFEVNPYIDIGENNQESFDHQKALAGSTSFGIKHAIGNEKEVESVTTVVATTHEIPKKNPTYAPGNYTFLYPEAADLVWPTTVLLPGNTLHASDVLSSGTDLVHSTPPAGAEVNKKYIWHVEPTVSLLDTHFKQGNALGADFHHSLLKLNQMAGKELLKHKKPKKLSTNNFPTFTKTKQPLKTFIDANWEKLIQQPKKNEHLVLQTTIHPSQKLFPVMSDTWTMPKTKLKINKQKKFIIKTDAIPFAMDFNKKPFPVVMKTIKSRRYRNVNPDFTAFKTGAFQPYLYGWPNRRIHQTSKPDAEDENDSKSVNQDSFRVSASYKIDRTLNKDPTPKVTQITDSHYE